MKKSLYLFSLLIILLLSCKDNKNVAPKEESIPQVVLPKNSKQKKIEHLTLPHDSIIAAIKPTMSIEQLLEKPFDLIELKRKFRMMNSTPRNKKGYYHQPEYDGFYYMYFIPDMIRLKLFVYKRKGQYQSDYNDPTEQLSRWTKVFGYCLS